MKKEYYFVLVVVVIVIVILLTSCSQAGTQIRRPGDIPEMDTEQADVVLTENQFEVTAGAVIDLYVAAGYTALNLPVESVKFFSADIDGDFKLVLQVPDDIEEMADDFAEAIEEFSVKTSGGEIIITGTFPKPGPAGRASDPDLEPGPVPDPAQATPSY